MDKSRRKAALGMLVVCSALGAPIRAADPTNDEQYSLELINRMRIEPLRELQRMVNIIPPTATSPATWATRKTDDPNVEAALNYFLVDADFLWNQWQQLTPAPPLAWNSNLHAAALGHNAKMIEFDVQDHQVPGEPDLGQRLLNAGYNYNTGGENIFAFAESVQHAHAGFAVDWGLLDDTGLPIPPGIQDPPGHRVNIMRPDFREVGISITPESDPGTEVGPLVITHDFGRRSSVSLITGVHYTDDPSSRDNFYTPGEGNSSVTVTARLPGTTTVVASTTTTSSGGYSLQLPAGAYDIAFGPGGTGNDIVYRNVVKGANNLKIDSLTTWIKDADASWHDPANWFAGVPNGEGTVASFYDVATAPRSVNVATPVTVGTINFENPAGYRIAGPGVVSLSGRIEPRGSINVIGPGSHEIGAGLLFAGSGATIAVDAGGALTLAGPVDFNNKTVTRTGGGVLNINGPQVHRTDSLFQVNAGTTNINSDGGTNAVPGLFLTASNPGTVVNFGSTQHLRGLRVEGARTNVTPGGNKVVFVKNPTATPIAVNAGTLDLNDNDMIVQSGAANRDAVLANVVNLIRSARNGPTPWQGNGITSSAAAANRLTTLAAMINPGLATFGGEAVDANAILIKYTWNGDANVDGKIDADDYFRIDQNFLLAPVNPQYGQGDFNYDSTINADDYFLIDQAFLGQGTPLESGALSGVAVPEPAAASMFVAITGLLTRRRRSSLA